eukprot:scaffold1868_cov194-Alexandrium_tamarense.AAC.46
MSETLWLQIFGVKSQMSATTLQAALNVSKSAHKSPTTRLTTLTSSQYKQLLAYCLYRQGVSTVELEHRVLKCQQGELMGRSSLKLLCYSSSLAHSQIIVFSSATLQDSLTK